jgi:hypothetical protein
MAAGLLETIAQVLFCPQMVIHGRAFRQLSSQGVPTTWGSHARSACMVRKAQHVCLLRV